MKIGVKLKINVSKIDKSQMFQGQKGVYLDAVAFIDIDNIGQYGDNGMIKQDVAQGEAEGNILGNATIFWNDTQPQQQRQAPQQQQQRQAPQRQQPRQAPQQNRQPAPQQHQAPQSDQFKNGQGYQQQPAPNFDDFSDDIPF
tara:strand:+ start:16352 stop:16777 length:426 start_codon:yes stop_codon:yes gene_type:complete